uniref:Uncharacterized protein n=2 Tax=Ornithorhynchus anatinus TaxID=9258 RepID=A0A6I8P876_ORNAN
MRALEHTRAPPHHACARWSARAHTHAPSHTTTHARVGALTRAPLPSTNHHACARWSTHAPSHSSTHARVGALTRAPPPNHHACACWSTHAPSHSSTHARDGALTRGPPPPQTTTHVRVGAHTPLPVPARMRALEHGRAGPSFPLGGVDGVCAWRRFPARPVGGADLGPAPGSGRVSGARGARRRRRRRAQTMGKNKAKRSKSKNVFQVASKRNMKAKNKAKPVTSNLKKISIINEEKIKSINKTLAAIQEQLTHLSKGITTEGPQRHLIPKHPKGELTGIEDALRLMALL